eukprot:SAG25_NODE_8767_length_405_cov_0.839869_1_plen_98_part_01
MGNKSKKGKKTTDNPMACVLLRPMLLPVLAPVPVPVPCSPLCVPPARWCLRQGAAALLPRTNSRVVQCVIARARSQSAGCPAPAWVCLTHHLFRTMLA